MEAAAIATLAAAAIGAVGSIQQGQAGKTAANYNAQLAQNNATYAGQQSAEEARRQRIMGAKAVGAARAGYGASGVSIEGSPLDVLEESARSAELDALSIEHGGQVRSIGFRNEATLDRFRGSAASRAGYMGAAATLLKGGAQAYSYMDEPAKTKPKRTGGLDYGYDF